MEVKETRKGGRALLILFIFSILVILLASYVSAAADVAYLYKKTYKIDDNILEIFNKSGLTVETISDTQIPTKLSGANLNNYKIIFVGDERFKNVNNIPVDKKPTIIANYYHGLTFGLTDYDGVSKLASNAPLSVRKNSQIVQVYTQAIYNGKTTSIPYYYLDDENKADGMQTAARTYTGNSYDFGDVISYADEGTHLQNGKTALGKICFFGIIESDYWTPAAEDMFEDCLGFVAMECASNADCPSQETGPRYCSNNDVYQNIEQFHCENPGKVNSQCVDDLISQKIEECDDGDAYTEDTCSNGACQHNSLECIQASDCGTEGWVGNPTCQENNVYQDYIEFSCTSNLCGNQTTSKLKEQCSEGCFNGACVEITCSSNIECGSDGYIGDEFCQGDDVYRDYQAFTCENPGTINSSCSSNSTPQLVEQCSGTCQDGDCIDIACSTDADCDDQDSGTEDNCHLLGTPASYCTNEPIVCFRNADCGINGYTGDFYCQSDNVFRNFQSHICFNAGTASSYCASNVTQILNTICPDTCYLGSCVDITCYNNADCDDGSAYTEDICLLPGTILSSCTHGDITCIQDSDCGADMFIGDTYCTGDDMFRDFKAYDCKNEGTTSSYCSSNITGNFLESCAYVCANGDCIRCNDNSDCDDQDSSTYDICRFSGTPESYCGHEHIECSTDIECGIDGFVGLPFCQGDDLYQDYREFDCKNEGTPGSYCDDDSTPQLIQVCEFGCAGSECLPGIHDVSILLSYADSLNGIRIKDEDTGLFVPGGPTKLLTCKDYEFRVQIRNEGDFIENVRVEGEINGNNWDEPKTNFSIGSTLTTIGDEIFNFASFIPGNYNVDYEIILLTAVDDDLSDNTRTRQINLSEAVCVENSDCGTDGYEDNYCIGNNVYHNFSRYTCENPCSFDSICTDSSTPEFVENCTYGCNNGTCNPGECIVDADCNDGLFCTGEETCVDNFCVDGTGVDCSGFDILAIGTCDNNPDNNPLTWDFRNAFLSTCDENLDSCTFGSGEITNTCDINDCNAECEQNQDCQDYCDGSTRYYNGNCNTGNCACSYDSCDEEALIIDYPQLRQNHGTGNINIINDGFLVFKGPNHDDAKVILHKQGGGQQTIYCHDLFGECPSGCQSNDDLCIYDRDGTLLYTDNFLTGNIPETKINNIQSGDWLEIGIGADGSWNLGLEIWGGDCPDEEHICTEEPECEEETLIQNYPHLDDEMEIDIDNEGYLIFKNSEQEGDVEDVQKVTLQKAGGGSQIIYCFDYEDKCPVGCQSHDDICILNRTGNFLYQNNYADEWGKGPIPNTKVDVNADDHLSIDFESWLYGYFGLEIWEENECPD